MIVNHFCLLLNLLFATCNYVASTPMDYTRFPSSGGSSSRSLRTSSVEDGYQHVDTPRPSRATAIRAAAQGYTLNLHMNQQGQHTLEHTVTQQSSWYQKHLKKMDTIDHLVRKVVKNPLQLQRWDMSRLQGLVKTLLTPVEGSTYTLKKEDMRVYLTQKAMIKKGIVARILASIFPEYTDRKLKPKQSFKFASDQGLSEKQTKEINAEMKRLGILPLLFMKKEPEDWEEITRPLLCEDQIPLPARMRLLYRWLWHEKKKRSGFLTRMDYAREKYYNEKYVLPSNFWETLYHSADPKYRHKSARNEASTSVATEEEASDKDMDIEDQEEQEEEEEEGNQEEVDLNLTLGGSYASQSHTASAGGQASPHAASAFDTSSWQQFSSAIPYYGPSGHSTQMYGYSHQGVNSQAQHFDSSLPYLQQSPQQQQQQQYFSGMYGYSHQNVNPAPYYDPNQQYQQQVYLQQQQFGQRGRLAERQEERRIGEQAGGSQGADYYGGGSSSGYYR